MSGLFATYGAAPDVAVARPGVSIEAEQFEELGVCVASA